jgi:hypothetical protein
MFMCLCVFVFINFLFMLCVSPHFQFFFLIPHQCDGCSSILNGWIWTNKMSTHHSSLAPWCQIIILFSKIH